MATHGGNSGEPLFGGHARIGRGLETLLHLVEYAAAIILAVDVAVVFLSVIYRYFLHHPLHWAEEVARARLCCTDHGWGRNAPSPVRGSCDADGLRASQLQHAVQDLDRYVYLRRLTLVRTRAQPVPDHALEAADRGLGAGPFRVSRRLLPAHPALLGDEVQVAVALRRRSLGRGAGHGTRARWDDNVRVRVALGHVGVNALLVVRAVRRDGGDRVRDLVQHGADLGGVVFVALGQGGGHDPAGLGVHAETELPPRPAPLGAVLLDQPLARALELQPRAVDQQVHGAGIAASAATRTVAARLRPRHLQRLGPAAQGGVVRHGEIEPEQADDGADQPFGLPVRQPEHGLERQRRQDRQVGIRGLPAPAREPLGLPRLDRLVRKPDRHAAAPAQALVVLAPVRDLALLFGDVAAAVLVQLKGQDGHPGSGEEPPCYFSPAPGATGRIRATTCFTREQRGVRGVYVYEFKVLASNGRVSEVSVNAATAKIIEREVDD